MRVTFLGTGMSVLSAERAGAALFVAEEEAGILLDCGPGALERAAAAGIALERIQAVFLSHLHFDHALGMAELLTRLAFTGKPLPAVYGPAATGDYVSSAAEYGRTQLRYLGGGRFVERLERVEVEEVASGDERVVAGLRVASVAVPHSEHIAAQARRVSVADASGSEGALIYGGDCRPAPEVLIPFGRDAAVLVHECYSEEGLRAYAETLSVEAGAAMRSAFARSHSTVGEAARIAQLVGVRRLALTHLLPTEREERLFETARQHFAGDVIIARDGLSIAV